MLSFLKKHKRLVFISTAILMCVFLNPISLFVLWILGIGWSNSHPDTGANARRVSWLPSEASNISYYRTYSWTAFEFDIDEKAFKKWAHRWDIKSIRNEERIPRYSYYKQPYEKRNSKEHLAVVRNGLYASCKQSNGGGCHVVYDREKHKAYFQSNPR